ncbi:tyrosine-type recombinase/integrase [Bacteroides thetaiotaomicron]|nr:tyrosine-type recombinase/integrase [Bacteroides thetaiotaomicron]
MIVCFSVPRLPFRTITCHAIHDIVRKELHDVSIKHKGPHSLRHSYATFLINNGQTMKEVGDLLGHKSIDSTRIYAKVDFQSLREVSNINFDGVL